MAPKKEGSENVQTRRANLEERLIENIVELQKVNTNMAEKFDSLTKQISSLLTLFESAAQNFAKNPVNQFSEKDQEFLEKIDKLLDQNKTIAKGLTMMEERIREKIHTPGSGLPAPMEPKTDKDNDQMTSSIANRPLPRF